VSGFELPKWKRSLRVLDVSCKALGSAHMVNTIPFLSYGNGQMYKRIPGKGEGTSDVLGKSGRTFGNGILMELPL
jgi:hypothetical protein